MCGIVGFVNNKENKEKIIKDMSKKIEHRGPDGEGFYIDDNCALAHRRLAIIDLNTGAQPIYNEDKSKVIIYNGEVYNFKELKDALLKKKHVFKTKTDTEVILHGYEQWGEKLPNHLRGMFSFAIWDKNKNELFMARDGFGIKPLYYAKFNDTFMFASEPKAFLANPDFEKKLNTDILSAYLCFNSVPTSETFFKGVYRLDPGTYLIYKDGKIKTKSFFTLEFKEKNDDMDKIVDNIDKAMKNSVEYHQISDVEVGSFLSSGIDSSYIVSLAKPDKTFTVGYDNPKFDEISYAKDLSDKLGIENYSKKITMDEYIESFPKIMYYMDEPLADPSAIALYFVSEIASKEVKVVLSGEGADEFFAGYNSYQEELTMQGYMKLPYFLRHIVSNIVSIFPDIRGFNFLYRRGQKLENYNIGLGRVFRDKEAQSIVKIPNQINTKDIVKNVYNRYKDNSTLIQRQMIDYYYWLVNDFLHAVDRNTMMFGLEARTPFLDNKVYEVAKSLPTYAKINKETTKVALRKAASKVIPNEAYKKKKLGFPVPLREWIKTDKLYNIIKEKFNGESAKLFFDTKKINKLLEEHKNGKRDSYKKVWTIYTFLVWYDIYFNEI